MHPSPANTQQWWTTGRTTLELGGAGGTGMSASKPPWSVHLDQYHCTMHNNSGGGATTTGPDATHPPTIFQNLGGGGCSCRGSGGGGVWPGVRGGGVRVRVTELVEPVLVL